MSDQPRSEKEEKPRREEGASWDEKWRRDPVEAAVWALILIWAGLVWLMSSAGFLTSMLGRQVEASSIAFIGAGLIVLLGVVVRLLVPAYRRPVIGSLIFGIILLGIGLGDLTNWAVIGALVLIGIGASILLGGLLRRP
jgi:hypothetical protein